SSESGQRTYDHAITEFVDWYCSEPRLAFNRTVVLRYRIYLEQRQYAPTTINLRLAAVRRVAFEAADSGLLSPELAAGIRRVKGGGWDHGGGALSSDTPDGPGLGNGDDAEGAVGDSAGGCLTGRDREARSP